MIPWAQAYNPNGSLIGSAVFAQLIAQSVPILYNGTPFPRQNCPFPRGIWTPINRWFPWPTRVHNPNGISIGSPVIAGLTSVTDRQTHRQTMILGR